MRRTMWIAPLIFSVAAMTAAQEIKKVPARYTSPSSGAEMYKAYCASCHGLDGKGNGPAAMALKAKLPDLTQLTKINNGQFPSDRIEKVILGDNLVAAHGDKNMPVWGPAFLALDQRDHSLLNLRLKNLAHHIESLQAK